MFLADLSQSPILSGHCFYKISYTWSCPCYATSSCTSSSTCLCPWSCICSDISFAIGSCICSATCPSTYSWTSFSTCFVTSCYVCFALSLALQLILISSNNYDTCSVTSFWILVNSCFCTCPDYSYYSSTSYLMALALIFAYTIFCSLEYTKIQKGLLKIVKLGSKKCLKCFSYI